MNNSTKLTIKIKELTINCIIGILPHERENEQRVVIDCSFEYYYTQNNFINYADVAQLIESIMIERKFELLEDALLIIQAQLHSHYNIDKLKLEITKPDILSNCQVSLSL